MSQVGIDVMLDCLVDIGQTSEDLVAHGIMIISLSKTGKGRNVWKPRLGSSRLQTSEDG